MSDNNNKSIAVTDLKEVARAATGSRFFAHNAEQTIMILTIARELGISDASALIGFNVINGRPTFSSGLIKAMVFKSPKLISWDEVSTDTECKIQATREKPAMTVTEVFTIADAQRAGLATKQQWRQYPRQMLLARCVAAMARRLFPEVAAGLYEPGEMGGDLVEHATHSAHTDSTPVEASVQQSSRVENASTEPLVGWNREEEFDKIYQRFLGMVEELGTDTDCENYKSAYDICLNLCGPLNKKTEFRKKEQARISALSEVKRKAYVCLASGCSHISHCENTNQLIATIIDYAGDMKTVQGFKELWPQFMKAAYAKAVELGGAVGSEGEEALRLKVKQQLSLEKKGNKST